MVELIPECILVDLCVDREKLAVAEFAKTLGNVRFTQTDGFDFRSG